MASIVLFGEYWVLVGALFSSLSAPRESPSKQLLQIIRSRSGRYTELCYRQYQLVPAKAALSYPWPSISCSQWHHHRSLHKFKGLTISVLVAVLQLYKSTMAGMDTVLAAKLDDYFRPALTQAVDCLSVLPVN
ncbi:MAG: hypothetical protein ACI9WS_001434 [Paraglaciecola psychrophila]|jgi:hypothetical protein